MTAFILEHNLTWRQIRAAALGRDEYICAYCCDPADQVDHIIPRSRGGSDDFNNLTAACAPCNQSKGALTPREWAQRDGMKLTPWMEMYA